MIHPSQLKATSLLGGDCSNVLLTGHSKRADKVAPQLRLALRVVDSGSEDMNTSRSSKLLVRARTRLGLPRCNGIMNIVLAPAVLRRYPVEVAGDLLDFVAVLTVKFERPVLTGLEPFPSGCKLLVTTPR
jgi:hypothetical protein